MPNTKTGSKGSKVSAIGNSSRGNLIMQGGKAFKKNSDGRRQRRAIQRSIQRSIEKEKRRAE